MVGSDPLPGDRVEYAADDVFDQLIVTGEIGTVVRVEEGRVFAEWPRSGVHGVPLKNVRLARPE